MEAGPRWQIVLADDHAMVRAGLHALIAADARCMVIAEVGDLARLRAVVATQHPDVVVLDLTLGQENGLDALPDLLAASPAPKIVVLTMHDDPAFAKDALGRGAHGFVLKEAAPAELIHAIETVMDGGTYLQPELGARMLRARPAPGDNLTSRERDVLRLLARGRTNAEIAEELFISLRTVEAHRADLRHRLGASTRSELVDAARTLRLLS